MKTTILKLTIFLFITISIFSCKKEKQSNLTIADGWWRLTAAQVTITGGGGAPATTDLITTMSTCIKDNLHRFNTSGTISGDEGATKCNAANPQTRENIGSWSINNNHLVLNYTTPIGLESIDGEVLEMTNTTIRISETESDGFTTITRVATFTHQ